MVAGVGLYPSSVFLGPFGQNWLGDRILAVHIAEEIHDMLRACQHRQVSLDHDAVETVIYKDQEAFKELRKGFHRSPPQMVWLDTKIICLATGGINPLQHPTPSPWDFKGCVRSDVDELAE